MGSGRDFVLICLIGFLLWRAEARHVGVNLKPAANGNSQDETTAPTTPPAPAAQNENTAPAAAPTTPPGAAAQNETKAPAAATTTPPGAAAEGPTLPGTTAQGSVFDVTKHGAVGDGSTDNNKAFAEAWAAACKSTGSSTFLVPKGEFLLSSIVFSGPCSNDNSPRVEINGKIVAPSTAGESASKLNAWILFQNLGHLNITGKGTGELDGKGESAWTEHGCRHNTNSICNMLPTSVAILGIKGGSLSDITSTNSKAFHILIANSNDFTVHDVKINAPQFSPNTDGIHIGDSTGITVTNSIIGTGDDCVSIGSGTSNIAISNIQCGPGHGISVGSLGRYPNEKEVKGLSVKNCTFTNTDNGVRIKTWPGAADNTVSGLRFEDLVMTNVSNPIIINQQYCDKKGCDPKPSRVKLTDIHYKNIKGTSFTQTAVTLSCSEGMPCENVELVEIQLKPAAANGDTNSTCSNAKGVASGTQIPKPCF